MTGLIVAVFLASLLGSFHCAGMCGAFLAIASGEIGQTARCHAMRQGAYHAGRLVTYMLLGAAAGAAGRLVNIAGALGGLRPLAAALAGAMMILFGAATILRTHGVRLHHLALPAPWVRAIQSGHRAAMHRPPIYRALLIGLLTTLLPCGWLYAFAATAAGMASPLGGAGVMAVFWLGTLPMLVAVGAGLRTVLGPLGARLPAMTALFLVIAGLYTLVGRTLLDPVAMAGAIQSNSMKSTISSPMNPARAPDPKQTPVCCKTHDTSHR